jgi:putative transposase
MKSKPVAFLLADLGVPQTHSRPHVSDDNAYSEAHFKTIKYRPDFPDRFGSIEDARAHCRDFFAWYNDEHHHAALGMLTLADVHRGLVEQRVAFAPGRARRGLHRAPRALPARSPNRTEHQRK